MSHSSLSPQRPRARDPSNSKPRHFTLTTRRNFGDFKTPCMTSGVDSVSLHTEEDAAIRLLQMYRAAVASVQSHGEETMVQEERPGHTRLVHLCSSVFTHVSISRCSSWKEVLSRKAPTMQRAQMRSPNKGQMAFCSRAYQEHTPLPPYRVLSQGS